MRVDGEKVKHRRERLALSIDAASNVAEVAPQTWLRAEHGGELRPSSVRRIAESLGAAPEDLLEKAPAPPSPEAPEEASEEKWREDLDKLRELLSNAGARTTHLALQDAEFEGLWEGKSAEQRKRINQELLEERRLIKPLLVRWTSLPPGSREREQLHRLWLQVYLVRLLSIAVEKNQEAAQTEADAARLAGNEARARKVLEEAKVLAEVA